MTPHFKHISSRLALVAGILTLLATATATAENAIPTIELTDEEISADTILNQVVEALPQEQVSFSGRLRSYEKSAQPQHKAHSGLRSSTYGISVTLHWGATPPNAVYNIFDKNQDLLESMTLKRLPNGSNESSYTRGPGRENADTPPLDARIQSTNLSWSDLSLSFLWWRGGKILGYDRVKGRSCVVIHVGAPTDSKDSYHHMKLWIDATYHVLMRAEGYDENEKIQRRMAVKSLKKFDDLWMIKDLEIENLPSRFKTVLTIDELQYKQPTATP